MRFNRFLSVAGCVLVACLLSFGGFGVGVGFAMKGGEGSGGKEVSKAVKRYLNSRYRNSFFVDELDNSERKKVIKHVSGREGGSLLNLLAGGKDFELLWSGGLSKQLKEKVWPHLSSQAVKAILGDGGKVEGFVGKKERKWLEEIKVEVEQNYPLVLPEGNNGKIVFGNVAWFLETRDICRFVLMCDRISPKGREFVANNQVGGVKNVDRGHWKTWLKTDDKQWSDMFWQLTTNEMFEVWNAGSNTSKNKLWKKLTENQRSRVLGFEGGLHRLFLDEGAFGPNVKTRVLNSATFTGVMDVAWEETGTVWDDLAGEQRSDFLQNHPSPGIKQFFTNLITGKLDSTISKKRLGEFKVRSENDLATTVWPELEYHGRLSWLKNIESHGIPELYGFFYDLANNNIDGKYGKQAKYKAISVEQPHTVINQIWDLLTEKDKQRLTPALSRLNRNTKTDQSQQTSKEDEKVPQIEITPINQSPINKPLSNSMVMELLNVPLKFDSLTNAELAQIWPNAGKELQEQIQTKTGLTTLIEQIGHKTVLKHLPPNTIITIAGTGEEGFSGDGEQAIYAKLNRPEGVFVTSDSHIYITDTYNNRVRHINPQGVIHTIAGTGERGYRVNGEQATNAKLDQPSGVFVTPNNDIYIVDTGNSRVQRVSPEGIIQTVVGPVGGISSSGFGGDGGQATNAKLNHPSGVFVTPDNHIYIADKYNHRVRRVNPQGVIHTIAGTNDWGIGGDSGPATNAKLNYPYGVFVTLSSHVYITGIDSHRVRRITPQGVIYTIVGTGQRGFSGDNGQAINAQLSGPHGVFVTPDNHIYITDTYNNRIRHINPQGIIHTIAGNGEEGYGGDGEQATKAKLRRPHGVFVTPDNHIYITDTYNHRIRAFRLDTENK